MTMDLMCDPVKCSDEQESQFRERRRKYREEAWQHACADPVEVEKAREKLNNVLTWDKGDAECAIKLAEVLALVHSAQHPVRNPITTLLSILDGIPEVRHEDVIRARLGNDGASAAFMSPAFMSAACTLLCTKKRAEISALIESSQHPVPDHPTQLSILDGIREVRHEDVIRARLDDEGARVAAFSVLCFIAIWLSLILGTQNALL
ncbi:unnamed protein product [Calypogeia fissa]